MNKWGEKKTAEETSYTGQTKKKKKMVLLDFQNS